MSVGYRLARNPVAAAIVAWYLLMNAGDEIAFIPDDGGHYPFRKGTAADDSAFQEVTARVVSQLIEAGILVDEGRDVLDPSDPDVYIRSLRSIWMEGV